MKKGYLVKSKWTSGRWCIESNELSCGYPISIKLNGVFIEGRIEHNSRCYYFLSNDGFKIDLSEELYARDDYKK